MSFDVSYDEFCSALFNGEHESSVLNISDMVTGIVLAVLLVPADDACICSLAPSSPSALLSCTFGHRNLVCSFEPQIVQLPRPPVLLDNLEFLGSRPTNAHALLSAAVVTLRDGNTTSSQALHALERGPCT